jgi:hypothetical protein
MSKPDPGPAHQRPRRAATPERWRPVDPLTLINLRLLAGSIMTGGLATCIGMVLPFYVRIGGLTWGWEWFIITGGLVFASGLLLAWWELRMRAALKAADDA